MFCNGFLVMQIEIAFGSLPTYPLDLSLLASSAPPPPDRPFGTEIPIAPMVFFLLSFVYLSSQPQLAPKEKGGAKGERNVSYNACSRDRPFKEPTPFPLISPRKEKKEEKKKAVDRRGFRCPSPRYFCQINIMIHDYVDCSVKSVSPMVLFPPSPPFALHSRGHKYNQQSKAKPKSSNNDQQT